ncbi:hypothetical protein, partial [Archangium violaceum]|uniref:hypothetical protein n=1 Tax=Archangium violaceum TaxID=83451 RepID=UPI001269B52F
MWIRQRTAAWRAVAAGAPVPPRLSISMSGQHHVGPTTGAPTILLTPMILPYEDALWFAREAFVGRPLVVYGEGLTREDVFNRVHKA